MQESFKSLVDGANAILVLLPVNPSLDDVAASLALHLSLRDQKDVQVYCPSAMLVEFNRVIGVNKIVRELGNKNLLIEFVDYNANDIERVSYDIKDSQFKLTVIPKQKVAPPRKENISLTYSGISSDLIIMMGGVAESSFPALSEKELFGTSLVHIGISNIQLSNGRKHLAFSRPASSVCEITASLIKESGIAVDEDTATNLIMGIESTTDFLTSLSVTADTFQIVSELMRSGGRRSQRQQVSQKEFRQAVKSQTPIRRETQTVFGGVNQKPGQPSWLEPKLFKGAPPS